MVLHFLSDTSLYFFFWFCISSHRDTYTYLIILAPIHSCHPSTNKEGSEVIIRVMVVTLKDSMVNRQRERKCLIEEGQQLFHVLHLWTI